jgi:signal transduction histidine kinase
MSYTVSRRQPPVREDAISIAVAAHVADTLGVPREDVQASTFGRGGGFIRRMAEDATPTPATLDTLPFFGGTRIYVRLHGDDWMVAQNPRREQDYDWLRFILMSFVGATLLLIPLALLFARRLGAPISSFAEAAERLGRDPNSPLLAEEGPGELRQAARSFNTMQDRLRKFVAGRTLMLAAISHDLRTPLQRMRFRIDALPDDERAALLADIEEMEAMVASTLAFSRDEASPGERESLDLGALVSSICDEASDQGGATQCSVDERVVVNGDPVRLKRALSNLVSNALKYAGAAEVRVTRQPGAALVEIADRGPGIPEERIEEMFQPFRRLEPSRSRATGGFGLGLTIARTIARAHGGDVTLTQRPGGGLMAKLALPAEMTT